MRQMELGSMGFAYEVYENAEKKPLRTIHDPLCCLSKPYPYQFDYMNVKIKPSSNPSYEFQDYLKFLGSGYKETFKVDQKMKYYAPSSGGKASVDTFATRIVNDSNTDYKKAKLGIPA